MINNHQNSHISPLTNLQIGDIIFIRINNFIFTNVAKATLSWTNHVGIIVGFKDNDYWVAESTIPKSRITSLSKFLARSQEHSFTITRLNQPLTGLQKLNIVQATKKRMNIFYDTGFNLHSKRQFCSRFVYEILKEATGIEIGKIENFKTLLGQNPNYKLRFWKFWFLGRIPWERVTITPASLLQSPHITFLYHYPYQDKA